MKILLIEPPPVSSYGNIRVLGSFGASKSRISWPPMELMIIAGLLRKHGLDCDIFDANANFYDFEAVRQKIISFMPDVIVFTTSTTTIKKDLRVASIAKEVKSSIKTVAIGSHVMVLPQETLCLNEDLDIAVSSEAEMPVLNFIKNDLSAVGIKGICYRQGKDIIRNAPEPGVQNLDNFGIPAHDKLQINLYCDPLMKKKPMTITAAQRGCINNCIFCCMPLYGNYRKRSVDSVLEELHFIVGLRIKELYFFDAGFNYDLAWTNNLLDKMISNKINLSWKANARAGRLTLELAKKMKEAGCHSLSIGAESADAAILKNIKKNVTIEQVRGAVNIAKSAGLKALVFFSFGWPGETRASMENTIRFAKSLKTDLVTFGQASPHPGTEFYKYIDDNGYFNTRDWEKFDPLFKPVFDYPQVRSDEINAMVKKAYKSFYFRPTYLIKRALAVRSFLEARNDMANFSSFLKRYVFAKGSKA